jgi:hypothetical protein
MMNDVIAGQRFRDAAPTVFGHPPPDWVVDEVFTGPDGVRYARVHSAANPHERKTLSATILRDKRRFIPAERSAVP